ncbi:hypothetical protein ABTZ21_00635 [Streptomyces sp. NPDC096191]|uniref:hypothetical protein n=1 Tax=Streptomyces sp. NPDC096191 TaxID=3155426 RepID=UPI00331D2986
MSVLRLRIAAGVGALLLTVLLTATPEAVGLFEWARAEAGERGRAGEALIFAWALIALPVAGLLQTPVARLRGAHIGAGWALLTGYWLLVLLLAPVAWQVEALFPATDGPGKSGGLFGAAIGLVIGTVVYAVVSGSVFREAGAGETPPAQVREHLAAVVVLTAVCTGAVVGLVLGRNFPFPRAGAPAMFLPGGVLWGLHAGAAVGLLAAARLRPYPDQRLAATAADFARTGTALLVCSLCVSQLGWFLPGWAVAAVGVPAPFLLFMVAGRSVRVGRWVRFQTVELPKGALA